VAHDFSGRHEDLLIVSYDCLDRIVLNAYLPLGRFRRYLASASRTGSLLAGQSAGGLG
jgi:hypothetical protein